MPAERDSHRSDEAAEELGLTYGLQDVEQIRLVLNGQSVVDWRRLALRDLTHVDELLARVGIDVRVPGDAARLNWIHEAALDYINTHFDDTMATEVSSPRDVRDLFLLASRGGALRGDACTVLKVMHIIHHAAGRELLYRLPIPISELFYQVECDVFAAIDGMKAEGVRVVELAGSRKSEHAIITKLLCRRDSQAAQVHDRQRFRVVTETLDDVLGALVYMTRKLLPFNYVVPGESRNDLVDLGATIQADPRLRHFQRLMQRVGDTDDDVIRVNKFTDQAYRDINFVVDMPVRLDDSLMTRAGIRPEKDGRVVFILVEFQLVDRKSHHRNNKGKSRHVLYKARQRAQALSRLRPGST